MNNDIRALAVTELGLADLPQEMQDEVLAQIGENVMRGVAVAALEKLSPEDQAEFERLAGSGDEAGTLAFLSSKIPDFNAFVAEESKKAIAELKELIG
ncbi:MAG: hypothetical protein A2408_02965 [Candidatus Yonathbacteria bacterium RIFOXYC1_FULL_52_10]|uniref:Uncharacterized protein n=1 Tax=Candidatus Yonathbacteria bacterium RIFOXYD1_FULL_52_36 TaxID=1802730 RepID=A0A1G2SI10_9BACT|nr:MAG: hypothetical protein A2408_02965 [Candidatus Yonathbacteria bacterium RIFOXYC1_FULL_52_10]OHA84640.1 MAG: hypothetical protein A2591_02860 [Candidatus Yonathbacteria bacterium RIFOXYD1_FULL_52_36]